MDSRASCWPSNFTARRASSPDIRIFASSRCLLARNPLPPPRPLMMTAPHIHLASKSPRRQDLLRQLGVNFDLLKLREASGRDRDVVEGAKDAEPPLHYVERMARTKVTVGWSRMQQRMLHARPVLSADTEVVLDGVVFGKPLD